MDTQTIDQRWNSPSLKEQHRIEAELVGERRSLSVNSMNTYGPSEIWSGSFENSVKE
jgi:hypothetical protein